MDVAIVKYNAGNIYSVVNAMKRLGIEPVLTDDAEMLQKADRVLFPGQGQAREAMEYLEGSPAGSSNQEPQATRPGHLRRTATLVPTFGRRRRRLHRQSSM